MTQVCVCDRIFSGEDVPGDTEFYLVFYPALESLTSHSIKLSHIYTIYFVDFSKTKEHSFPSHAIYLSQYLSLGPPVSSFFPDLRETRCEKSIRGRLNLRIDVQIACALKYEAYWTGCRLDVQIRRAFYSLKRLNQSGNFIAYVRSVGRKQT
jgi:hypothetical protein